MIVQRRVELDSEKEQNAQVLGLYRTYSQLELQMVQKIKDSDQGDQTFAH